MRKTILDEALAALPDWKRKGYSTVCLSALDNTVAAAVTSTLNEVREKADAFSDATKTAIAEKGLQEFVAKEEVLLDAVRAAIGSAASDKLEETRISTIASDVAATAAPLATSAFDQLVPAFDSIVATAADVIVENGLNEDTLASFFLPLSKLLRLPANESAPGLGDKLWSGKPHPLNSAAEALEALPTAVVGALEAVDEAALRTRGGKLAMAALKLAPSPLEAEGDDGGSSGADSWQTQAAKWFVSAISAPLGELLERAAYMFEVLLSEKCEVIALAPTEQQLREAVGAAAASVREDLVNDATSTKQVAVVDAFRRLLGVAYISAVGQTAGDSVQSLAYPEFDYNYARVLTVERGLRRVLDMVFDEIVLRTNETAIDTALRTALKESVGGIMFPPLESEEGEPPEPPDLDTAQQLKGPAEAAAPAPEDADSSAAVQERVAKLEEKEQQDATELARKDEAKTAAKEQVDTPQEDEQREPEPEPKPVDGTAPAEAEPQSTEAAGEETETAAAGTASEPAPEPEPQQSEPGGE